LASALGLTEPEAAKLLDATVVVSHAAESTRLASQGICSTQANSI
jgi:hypothetical protein